MMEPDRPQKLRWSDFVLENLHYAGYLLLVVLLVAALALTIEGALHLRKSISRFSHMRTAPTQPMVTALPSAADVQIQIHHAYLLFERKKMYEALQAINGVLEVSPRNIDAFVLRGNIYTEKKEWDQALKDYQQALQLDTNNARIKFNLAEIQFLQKKYDNARAGFLPLEKDQGIGDISAYKVFLCDLFGGHEDVAARELDAFNRVGSNPSYYFANAAWSLFHRQTEDGRGWLRSASYIYSQQKCMIYASSLIKLGYIPAPTPILSIRTGVNE